MKRYFVIEADTEMYSAFVYEVSREMDKHGNIYVYGRPVMEDPIFNQVPGPKFYGKLHTLLVTQETLKLAKPIEPEPQNKIDSRISESEQAVNRAGL